MLWGVHKEVSLVSGQVWTVSRVCTNNTSLRQQAESRNMCWTVNASWDKAELNRPLLPSESCSPHSNKSTTEALYELGVTYSSLGSCCHHRSWRIRQLLQGRATGPVAGLWQRSPAGHSQGRRERGFGTATVFCPSAVTPAAGSGHEHGLQTLFFTKHSDLFECKSSEDPKERLRTDDFSWILHINLLWCSYAILLITKLIATLPTLLFHPDEQQWQVYSTAYR